MLFLWILLALIAVPIIVWAIAKIGLHLWMRSFIGSPKYRAMQNHADRMIGQHSEAETLAEQAEAAAERGDMQEAARCAHRAAELFGESGNHFMEWELQATAYRYEGDNLRLAEAKEEAVKCIPPGWAEPLRARLLLEQSTELRLIGRYERAFAVSIQAVQAIESKADPVAVPARPDGAMEMMTLLAPSNAEVSRSLIYRQAAQLAATHSRFEQATQYAARAAEVSENERERREAIDTMGFVRAYEGRLTESLRLREQLVTAEKPSAKEYSMAADVLVHLGRWEEAIARYHQAMEAVSGGTSELTKKNTALYEIGLARVLIERGQLHEAKELLLAARPVYPAAHLIVCYCDGLLLLIAAKTAAEPVEAIHEKALLLLDEIDTAMAAMPVRADALRYSHDEIEIVAQVLYHTGHLEECLLLLRRLGETALLPVEQPRHHYFLGRCHEALGDIDAAILAYRAAVSTTCESVERHVTLSRERLSHLAAE